VANNLELFLKKKRFDTSILIHVSNGLTRVLRYTCQNVQLVTFTSNTRLTRVKMHAGAELGSKIWGGQIEKKKFGGLKL
jgi:hypothetical protein